MNILVITPIWHGRDSNPKATRIVNLFVQEWNKQGHNVIVIHVYSQFPRLYYQIIRPIQSLLESRLGMAFTPHYNLKGRFEQDGAVVFNVPLRKWLPKTAATKETVLKAEQEVCQFLKKEGFSPDVVLGHWILASLELVTGIGKRFENATTSVVMHVSPKKYLKRLNSRRFQPCLANLDRLGYRSDWIRRELGEVLDPSIVPERFFCPSGVDEEFFANQPKRGAMGKKIRVVFVGSLYRRKHAISLLKAVVNGGMINQVTVDIVGDGEELQNLKRYSQENSIDVKFHGRLQRQDVIKVLDKAYIFIMVSERETFGLVYLEAMARRNIVIASRNEGMDGIIVNEHNGFLCQAGDDMELAQIMKRVINMSPGERDSIVEESFETATRLSSGEVAENYLLNLGK